MTNETQEQVSKELEGKILYEGTHDMGWVNKLLSSKEIEDCMRQAEGLFPRNSTKVWISGIGRELPVLVYRGRHPIADGGSLSGGTDGEVFNNVNNKGLRYYATAGIYRAEIGKSEEGSLGVILNCVTKPINVTDWYDPKTWERICSEPSVQRR